MESTTHRMGCGSLAVCLAATLAAFAPAAAQATTIHVPADYPTIQAAINAAVNGDTVLVAPGTYKENINFMGKAITVTSSAGPQTTIIDGGQNGSVVTFNSGEGLTSVLNGFTIQNGFANNGGDGGGIAIWNGTSPTIIHNTIINNKACDGAGVGVSGGSPLIKGNTIDHNVQGGCGGGTTGGGILLRDGGSAQIIGNVISNNSIELWGGGIGLFIGGTPTIQGNLIIGNSAGNGGGVATVNNAILLLIENVIVENNAPVGGGVYCSVPNDNPVGCFLINNTIADNTSSQPGSEVLMDGFDSQSQLVNNVIVGNSGQTAMFCDGSYSQTPPMVSFNDVFNSSTGPAYGGTCSSQSGTNGNISADPLFFDRPIITFTLSSARL